MTKLSPRERDVVRLIAAGCVTREIAVQLDVTEKTVYTYVRHIMEKTGQHTRLKLAVWWHKMQNGRAHG